MKAALEKAEIRKEVLRKRDSLSPEEKSLKDQGIRETLNKMPEFQKARSVLFFASFRSEADTLSLIHDAFKSSKKVLVPKVKGAELAIYEINSLEDLKRGYMGIPEPIETVRPADLDEADIVLMPGAAFDEKGGRLGYGKAYYDLMLAKRKRPIPLVALAYELQIVPGPLPLEPHDIRVDKIVTEKRTIDCHG